MTSDIINKINSEDQKTVRAMIAKLLKEENTATKGAETEKVTKNTTATNITLKKMHKEAPSIPNDASKQQDDSGR